MQSTIRDGSGKSQGFGLGFHVKDLDGYTRIGHGGAIYGFSTQLEALPERRIGVAAAASLDGPLTEVDDNTFAFPDYGLYHGESLKFARDAEEIATQVVAAEVKFVRREVGTKDGETFTIHPVKPIDDLRTEALTASPPVESGNFLQSDLVELTSLE